MRLLCGPALVALMLVLAGCGGSGDSGGADGGLLSNTPSPVTPTPTATVQATPAPTETAPTGALVGWAAGTQLLRSDDGGTHWSQVRKIAGRKLAFVDRTEPVNENETVGFGI